MVTSGYDDFYFLAFEEFLTVLKLSINFVQILELYVFRTFTKPPKLSDISDNILKLYETIWQFL